MFRASGILCSRLCQSISGQSIMYCSLDSSARADTNHAATVVLPTDAEADTNTYATLHVSDSCRASPAERCATDCHRETSANELHRFSPGPDRSSSIGHPQCPNESLSSFNGESDAPDHPTTHIQAADQHSSSSADLHPVTNCVFSLVHSERWIYVYESE